MSNLVIVAIPEEDDRVWKVSSEKVPHLTLLYLGDSNAVDNLQQIVEFVEHAATTTLNRFYLPVDRRDVLGADDADVLFFKKGRYDFKAVRDFRATLLQDNNIKTAYDKATQIEGPWLPHLTLGYPATPANPMPDNWGEKFYSVEFTKIAVWVSDYDGPEFLLKDYWDEQECLETAPGDFAMSDVTKTGEEVVAALFEHSGVKGMKWGVRKGAIGSGVKKTVKAIGKGVDNTIFELGTQSASMHQAIADDARKLLKADLPAIKAQHPTGGKKLNRLKNPAGAEAKAYRKDVKAAYLKHLETSANATTNFSGSRRYTLKDDGAPNTSKYFWTLSTEKNSAKHAATENGIIEIRIRPIFDEDGYITDLEILPDGMAQTAVHGEAFVEGLTHSGVKGMKWGVRKEPPSAVSPTATSKIPHGDKRKTKIEVEGGQNHPAHADAIKVAQAKAKLAKSGPSALSNDELREVANRVQLEQQVKVLVSSKGKKFVTQQLQNEGQNLARQGVRSGLKKGAKRVGVAALI